MSKDLPDKDIIGRVEKVTFPELGIDSVHARVDTGAKTSAIWASKIELDGQRLKVVFLGNGHPEYTGKPHLFNKFEHGGVASSNGQIEMRYKVKVLIKLAGRKIRARFTLADRSAQAYPVLIGRNVLHGKFIVDVTEGKPLLKVEKERSDKIQNSGI